jgi:hypothetical protein
MDDPDVVSAADGQANAPPPRLISRRDGRMEARLAPRYFQTMSILRRFATGLPFFRRFPR